MARIARGPTNPLADIRSTRKVSAVVANGRLFDSAALHALLRAALAAGGSPLR